MEDRVFDAAMMLYGQGGWSGFTFDAVARAANAGKNALYRRWPSRGALLREALERRWVSIQDIDGGRLEADLLALARMFMRHMIGPMGDITWHLHLDAQRHPEVGAAIEPYHRQLASQTRAIVRRAQRRGELPADASAALLLDVVFGAILSRVATTPRHLRADMEAGADRFTEQLVRLALGGATTMVDGGA